MSLHKEAQGLFQTRVSSTVASKYQSKWFQIAQCCKEEKLKYSKLNNSSLKGEKSALKDKQVAAWHDLLTPRSDQGLDYVSLHTQQSLASRLESRKLEEVDWWAAIDTYDLDKVQTLIQDSGQQWVDLQRDGLNALHLAAKNNNTSLVSILLQNSNKHIDYPDKQKRTALLIACEFGHLEIVKLLSDKCAKMDVKDKIGETIVHKAARSGKPSLLQWICGKNVVKVNVRSKRLETAIMLSCKLANRECVLTLINHGAEVTSVNVDGLDCCSICVLRRHVENLEAILNSNTSHHSYHTSNSEDHVRKSQQKCKVLNPVIAAVKSGSIACLSLLLMNLENPWSSDEQGMSALMWAIVSNSDKIPLLILSHLEKNLNFAASYLWLCDIYGYSSATHCWKVSNIHTLKAILDLSERCFNLNIKRNTILEGISMTINYLLSDYRKNDGGDSKNTAIHCLISILQYGSLIDEYNFGNYFGRRRRRLLQTFQPRELLQPMEVSKTWNYQITCSDNLVISCHPVLLLCNTAKKMSDFQLQNQLITLSYPSNILSIVVKWMYVHNTAFIYLADAELLEIVQVSNMFQLNDLIQQCRSELVHRHGFTSKIMQKVKCILGTSEENFFANSFPLLIKVIETIHRRKLLTNHSNNSDTDWLFLILCLKIASDLSLLEYVEKQLIDLCTKYFLSFSSIAGSSTKPIDVLDILVFSYSITTSFNIEKESSEGLRSLLELPPLQHQYSLYPLEQTKKYFSKILLHLFPQMIDIVDFYNSLLSSRVILDHLPSIAITPRLQLLFQNEIAFNRIATLYYDVVVKCEDCSFPCHREVLLKHENKFAALVRMNELIQSKSKDSATLDIVVCEYPPLFVKCMLHFLYCGYLPMIAEIGETPIQISSFIIGLLYAADEYLLVDFITYLENELVELLCVENMFEIYDLTQTISLPSLQRDVELFIALNYWKRKNVDNYDDEKNLKRLQEIVKSILTSQHG